MRIEDLVDLEVQLVADQEVAEDELHRRDRSIARGWGDAPPSGRGLLLAAWLSGLREAGQGPAVGRWLARARRWAALLLLLLGLGSGWALAELLLAYDGSEPVNVLDFLLWIVGPQVVLIVLVLVAWPLELTLRVSDRVPHAADVKRLWRSVWWGLGGWLAERFEALPAEQRERWQSARNRLAARRSLYHGIEWWLLLRLAQGLAVAFNVGVLLSMARLVAFSDLAFAWSTTLDLEPAAVHGALGALAWPWKVAWSEAVPSLELVEATRWSRLEGAFTAAGAGGDAARASSGSWWRVLFAATITYGLVPRLTLWLVTVVGGVVAARRVRLDTPEVDRVVRRLTTPVVTTRSPEAPEGRVAPAPGAVAPAPTSAPVEDLDVLTWRDVPLDGAVVDALAGQRFGVSARSVTPAGGLDGDPGAIERSLGRPGGRRAVLILADDFEAPDRGFRRCVARVRELVGDAVPIVVGLVHAADRRRGAVAERALKSWRRGIARLRDPYVSVEALGDGP